MPEAEVTADRGLLYHYTSEEGLLGIIEHDNIRATHIRFLNDYTEFREAFQNKFVEVLLDSFRKELPNSIEPNARQVIEGVLSKRNHEAILKVIESSGSANEAFVCSFTAGTTTDPNFRSDPGDRLSQWRGYSHSLQGFSLGFDRTLLKDVVEVDDKRVRAELVECIYDDDRKVRLFQAMGNAAAKEFEELAVNNPPIPPWFQTNMPNASEQYQRVNSCFLNSLAKATVQFFTTAARIKHSGFSEEREWRIVLHANLRNL